MERNDIFEIIKRILRENVGIKLQEDIEMDCIIRNSGVDSIAMMALIVYVENELNISLDTLLDSSVEFLKFNDMIALIETQLMNN